MNNIIFNYVNNVKKRLKKYSILILKSKYDKDVVEAFIQTYVNSRYYNFDLNNQIRLFYRRIDDALERKRDELVKEEPRKTELINNILMFFKYYYYFDNVRSGDIEKVIDVIDKKRIETLNLNSSSIENFKEEFTKIIKKDISESKDFEKYYKSEDFELDIAKIDPKEKNYYRVKLKYFFDFPEIFSEEVIQNVFDTEIVAEDKLFVEYPMITSKVLLEIIDLDFAKKYVCDFSVDLLNKKTKLDQLIETLENQAAQDKIYFKITYDDFIKNKVDVFKLINRGFKFALETNDSMPKLSNEELNILEIFSCIIVSDNDINKQMYKDIKILENKG